MAEQTKGAGAVLSDVHEELKLQFENHLTMVLELTTASQGFYEPTDLSDGNVEEIIRVTNDAMANAAKDNNRRQIKAVSRQGNVLMSLARDNYSAGADRLTLCRNYSQYVKRALHEADPKDPTKSDGLLQIGIKKVDL
jgi:hypothetical protein